MEEKKVEREKKLIQIKGDLPGINFSENIKSLN